MVSTIHHFQFIEIKIIQEKCEDDFYRLKFLEITSEGALNDPNCVLLFISHNNIF